VPILHTSFSFTASNIFSPSFFLVFISCIHHFCWRPRLAKHTLPQV
jgi:hypothetical protein